MKVLSHSRLMRRAKFSPRVIRCIFHFKSASSSASGSPCSRHRISPHDRVRSPGIFAYLRRWSGSNLWSTPTKPAGHFVAIVVLFCVPVLPFCSPALPVSSGAVPSDPVLPRPPSSASSAGLCYFMHQHIGLARQTFPIGKSVRSVEKSRCAEIFGGGAGGGARSGGARGLS